MAKQLLSDELHRQVERLAFVPTSAAVACGVSRTKIFELIRRGELQAKKTGKTTLVEREELIRWLKSLPPTRRRSSQDAQPGVCA